MGGERGAANWRHHADNVSPPSLLQGGPTAKSETGLARWQRPDAKSEGAFEWTDRHSKFNEENDRARAEVELLALAPDTPTTVLNLCGFWGGQRQVKAFIPRVATSKEILRGKVRARMRLDGVRSAHLGWIGEHPYDPRAGHLEGHPRRPCAL